MRKTSVVKDELFMKGNCCTMSVHIFKEITIVCGSVTGNKDICFLLLMRFFDVVITSLFVVRLPEALTIVSSLLGIICVHINLQFEHERTMDPNAV